MKNYCRGCGEESEYLYCEKCAKTCKCLHGNIINDGCPQCDIEGDLAFDAAREAAVVEKRYRD